MGQVGKPMMFYSLLSALVAFGLLVVPGRDSGAFLLFFLYELFIAPLYLHCNTPGQQANMEKQQLELTSTYYSRASTALQRVFYTGKLFAQPLPGSLPPTSIERLTSSSEKTILYLAYGSNLSAETFKGARGIKPLSALNVHVPSLSLTFDLAGIPYIEPCFANTKYRTTTPPTSNPTQPPISSEDYHKDRWHKGLIGVVYEVTPEDYRTIIATEGGGASYQDVVVPCFAIRKHAKIVEPLPSGVPFNVHTLLMPHSSGHTGPPLRSERPDPSYAQPSARYLKLITDGGEEHGLPDEYMAYLYNIRPYRITTKQQRVGQALFVGFWGPLIMGVFQISKLFADDEGKIPAWMARIVGLVFATMWASYDASFAQVFGDGERTIGETDHDTALDSGPDRWWSEKSVRMDCEKGHL